MPGFLGAVTENALAAAERVQLATLAVLAAVIVVLQVRPIVRVLQDALKIGQHPKGARVIAADFDLAVRRDADAVCSGVSAVAVETIPLLLVQIGDKPVSENADLLFSGNRIKGEQLLRHVLIVLGGEAGDVIVQSELPDTVFLTKGKDVQGILGEAWAVIGRAQGVEGKVYAPPKLQGVDDGLVGIDGTAGLLHGAVEILRFAFSVNGEAYIDAKVLGGSQDFRCYQAAVGNQTQAKGRHSPPDVAGYCVDRRPGQQRFSRPKVDEGLSNILGVVLQVVQVFVCDRQGQFLGHQRAAAIVSPENAVAALVVAALADR